MTNKIINNTIDILDRFDSLKPVIFDKLFLTEKLSDDYKKGYCDAIKDCKKLIKEQLKQDDK